MSEFGVTVIGGGLAGCEAAWQLANRGIKVNLYEMRPGVMTPAHTTGNLAELVCSNSLRSDRMENAVGLLKEEMRRLDSLIIKSADLNRVPAGGALAVDREGFSEYITRSIENHHNITLNYSELDSIDGEEYTIIATGPLSSPSISKAIQELVKEEYLFFFDAAAPIVTIDSLDTNKIFRASRYGRGDDYLNCPMTKEEYIRFWNELVNADVVTSKEFEKNVFEGCIPIEIMASRGIDTLRYGPLKPVGLIDPRTNNEPYAVVQLRQDNHKATLYNLVGFQTNLKFGEQKRVFSSIPGMEEGDFVRYGVMHRNTYINSPKLLNSFYQMKDNNKLYFAGQITGVEGYVESASSGLLAGYHLVMGLLGKDITKLPESTAMGALSSYISNPGIKDFQPMNVNFGIMESLNNRIRNKQKRNLERANQSLKVLDQWLLGF